MRKPKASKRRPTQDERELEAQWEGVDFDKLKPVRVDLDPAVRERVRTHELGPHGRHDADLHVDRAAATFRPGRARRQRRRQLDVGPGDPRRRVVEGVLLDAV